MVCQQTHVEVGSESCLVGVADGHIIAESCSHCQEHFIPNTVTVVNISFLIVLVAYTELSS